MKVLIELIDSQQILNVVTAMTRNPDKVIFLSDETAAVLPPRDVLQKYLNCPYTTEYCPPEKLEDFIKGIRADEIEIDIHGGNDLAVSLLTSYAGEHDITLCYPGFTTSTMYTVKRGVLSKSDLVIPKFTVSEIIALHGGAVRDLPEAVLEGKNREAVYACCGAKRAGSKQWLKFCSAMASIARKNEGNAKWRAPAELYSEYSNIFERISCVFRKCSVEGDKLILELANPDYKVLITDTGVPFEYETYYQLEDSRYFDDVDIRVNIDWNGGEFVRRDPNSELDVMATKDGRLISVSCKSGKYDQQAIYEVKANAVHFGGELAVSVLCTDYERTHSEYEEKAKAIGVLLIQYEDMREGKAAQRIIDWMKNH